jgi:hypothetical protein
MAVHWADTDVLAEVVYLQLEFGAALIHVGIYSRTWGDELEGVEGLGGSPLILDFILGLRTTECP